MNKAKIENYKKRFEAYNLNLSTVKESLVIGAKDGCSSIALQEMGVKNSVGIDLSPLDDSVLKCNMHNLSFKDNTFDLVYFPTLVHSSDPQKAIQEAERVLKVGGCLLIDFEKQKDEAIFKIEEPIFDVLPLTNTTLCSVSGDLTNEIINRLSLRKKNYVIKLFKDGRLEELYKESGNISTVKVPEDYLDLWKEINLEIQNKKLNSAMIYNIDKREDILNRLSKRAFYLTKVAQAFDCKKIAEVGTAEGWQYYTFCKYVDENHPEGNVSTCDPRDVRNKKYKSLYNSKKKFKFFNATSLEMAMSCGKKDMFYVDGLHDEGTVLQDVYNLRGCQKEGEESVWVFDDFDVRFGCANDIMQLLSASAKFKVYKVGLTASGKPSHQAIAIANYRLG